MENITCLFFVIKPFSAWKAQTLEAWETAITPFSYIILSQTFNLFHKLSPVDSFSWTVVQNKIPLQLTKKFQFNEKSY